MNLPSLSPFRSPHLPHSYRQRRGVSGKPMKGNQSALVLAGFYALAVCRLVVMLKSRSLKGVRSMERTQCLGTLFKNTGPTGPELICRNGTVHADLFLSQTSLMQMTPFCLREPPPQSNNFYTSLNKQHVNTTSTSTSPNATSTPSMPTPQSTSTTTQQSPTTTTPQSNIWVST